MLQAEAQTLTTLFIVLDALDEYTKTNYCRVKILSEIRKLGSNLRILVTGREHVESILLESFPGAKRMEIRASDEDIRKFVDGCIEIEQNLKRLHWSGRETEGKYRNDYYKESGRNVSITEC